MPADPVDIYEWEALYKIEYENKLVYASLSQYNQDGSKISYKDIPRDNLYQFILFRIGFNRPVIVVNLDCDKRLIWRMRVEKNIMSGKEICRVHLIGWQQNVRGVNQQVVFAIFPDGMIEVVDRFREDHPWAYPVVFNDSEKL